MSDKRERERRRDERLAQESQAVGSDRRTKLLQLGAAAVFLAIAAVVVLIVASSGSSGGDAENIVGARKVNANLRGIPQRGLELGDPKAEVEVVEYGDLQCPVCRANSEEVMPGVIEAKVRSGEARVVFRNFVVISEESKPAGAAALAAGEQGHGWQFLDLFYRNQGEERSGYVTDEFMTAVAEAAGVPDMARWQRERESAKLLAEIERTSAQAQQIGFEGTPSFAIRGPGTDGLELLQIPGSSQELVEEIEKAA